MSIFLKVNIVLVILQWLFIKPKGMPVAYGLYLLLAMSPFRPWISLGNVLLFRFLWEVAPGSSRRLMSCHFLEFNFSFGII
ncbi:hypothetical protein NC653_038003 [Populus alba x Populus x berolinensis]|uniref:Uncharacterized protein n=2 Tax=Populus alba x Populus x berolinensis TaxID=444605 RepID=A0AAD6LFJ5_9ROSI|nr:hypothetical protein NC653_038003 [Populus alba x Populus x berolinensis]